MEVPEYCCIEDCTEEGEKAHLVARANLPKSEWDNPLFYVRMCRKHHSEQHTIGLDTFCRKYGLEERLKIARQYQLSSS